MSSIEVTRTVTTQTTYTLDIGDGADLAEVAAFLTDMQALQTEPGTPGTVTTGPDGSLSITVTTSVETFADEVPARAAAGGATSGAISTPKSRRTPRRKAIPSRDSEPEQSAAAPTTTDPVSAHSTGPEPAPSSTSPAPDAARVPAAAPASPSWSPAAKGDTGNAFDPPNRAAVPDNRTPDAASHVVPPRLGGPPEPDDPDDF